jgi:hypothetical protein
MLRKAKFQDGTKLRTTSFYEIMSILIIIGIVSLSFAYTINNAVIHNTGKIVLETTAKSGYWRDIQDAIDLAASSGVGVIHIPEGTWNFVNVGESWHGDTARVNIPAGISVFGAPTERYANGSVVQWKTILQMPWACYDGKRVWFQIKGNGNPNKPSRFSDIKLVGWRSFDPSYDGCASDPPDTKFDNGLWIYETINFRVDHCHFESMCDKAVIVHNGNMYYSGLVNCGVIDHCLIDNPYGHTDTQPDDSNVDYGIYVVRCYDNTPWDSLENVLGKYLNYTTVVEDCVFTKWRSEVACSLGGHLVVRHCIFQNGLSRGPIDIHPTYEADHDSGRCMECYDNHFKAQAAHEGWNGVLEFWGGGGVAFNNVVDDYAYGNFLWIFDNGGPSGTPDPKYTPHYFIWNNTLGAGVNFKYGDEGAHEGVQYFLYSPSNATYTYTPYPYPHPLTLP